MEKILITGATGKYGFSVIESLVKLGVNTSSIYAMVRERTKTEKLESFNVNIVYGDYNNYASILKAFSGINKLLFVSSGEMDNRGEQHIKVVNAAKESRIKHIFYTSQEHKEVDISLIDFVLNSHLVTEKAIKESRITYTILRNGLYMDMLPSFLGGNVLNTGIYIPAGDGKIAFTLRSEMAETAAKIVMSEGHENKTYDISGNSISFSEIAQIISEIKGQNITYLSPDLGTYLNTVIKNGMPKIDAKMIGGFAAAAKQGELEGGNSQMEKQLGRKPTRVKAFLNKMYN